MCTPLCCLNLLQDSYSLSCLSRSASTFSFRARTLTCGILTSARVEFWNCVCLDFRFSLDSLTLTQLIFGRVGSKVLYLENASYYMGLSYNVLLIVNPFCVHRSLYYMGLFFYVESLLHYMDPSYVFCL